MYQNILFATTASPVCDNAAKVAFGLAAAYTCNLQVLHVFGIPSHGFRTSVIDRRTGEEETCSPDYIDWVTEEMKTTYAKQLEHYPAASVVAVAGIPHTEILRYARKHETDLIIMGAHTRIDDAGGLRYRNIIGSTMQQVARSARSPVMIVSRPCTTCATYFRHIVFATDFTSKCLHAFQYALQAAEKTESRLTVFHAVNLNECDGMVQDEIEERISEAQKKIEHEYLRNTNTTVSVEIIVREGSPSVEILKYARETMGDLIVMSHQTKPLYRQQEILTNTVEQVVLRSSCPVVSVNHPST